jgi:SAM-dependent methyltransferase
MSTFDPYDEVPYKSLPIEWTAPERLGLASWLHGGPLPGLDSFRVLELGCANGANLLPQAFYRRAGTFVGVDAARSQIAVAQSRQARLRLSNIEFLCADFEEAGDRLEGQFDYIIGHGVFSWVPARARDALLRVCAARLRDGGLLYLNYNTNPGWKIRGMVREFLLAQTAGPDSLGRRAQAAQRVAARLASTLSADGHAYSTLIASEFKFVCDNDASYIAHEYLAPENHAYWRSEFMDLLRSHGFEFVADADFNYHTGRLPDGIVSKLMEEQLTGRSVEDTVDFLCYRQLHSPILTKGPFARAPIAPDQFARLLIASPLAPCAASEGVPATFRHPSGYEVDVKDDVVKNALDRLYPIWPNALKVGDLFADVGRLIDDLRLLHRNGLIDLRLIEFPTSELNMETLRTMEREAGYFTTAYHTREAATA